MLISGGNLIKKVLFPAEVLPFVTVFANMVHFFLGLPILAIFLIYYQRPLDPLELLVVSRDRVRAAARCCSGCRSWRRRSPCTFATSRTSSGTC